MWRGWGKLHSESSRDYALYVWFEPYHPSGRGGIAINATGPEVTGWAHSARSAAKSYDLPVVGYLEKHMGASTDGKRMEVDAYRRPWYYSLVGKRDNRPRLEFHGAWHNPELILYDHGSFGRVFNSD
jgi:hypothetical protein